MDNKFSNEIELVVRSGDTGEIKHEYKEHNDVCDDFLCARGRVIINHIQSAAYPYCFLLPDGPNWTGFTFDRKNPWAPYSITDNRITDPSADQLYMGKTYSYVNNKHKFFYRWTNLPKNIQLRGIGLTNQDDSFAALLYGINDSAIVFLPQTLVVLPTAIPINGRLLGTQTPDILEISYYLSVVGV